MSFARVRALVVVGALAVAAVVFVIVALAKDSQQGAVASGCPAGSVMADVRLPDDPSEVTVKVYNATSTPGVADRVTSDFTNRRFKAQKPAENKRKFTGVAQLRYGPAAVGKAHLLQGVLPGSGRAAVRPEAQGRRGRCGHRHPVPAAGHHHRGQPVAGRAGRAGVPPGACAKPVKG